jgi:hypothetical protein
MLKKMPVISRKRFRGGGGQLAAQVRFVKHPEADSRLVQGVETLAQAGSVADATDDKGRVCGRRRKEGPSGLDGGMAGLHHLLRVGQVTPDEKVDVRTLINLPELHGNLLG